jgi:hypothetical protein
MYNNIPEGSKQTKKMLSIFTKKNKNAAKGKENKSSNLSVKNILFDDPNLIEESRKDFAAEYLAKYGDADIERRAISISNYPSPDSFPINQMNFNPDIYTSQYNCYTFYNILKKYKQNKNDINKLKLKTLLSDADCLRMIDTIGKNKDDPSNWNIPDGQFRALLNELDILEPYNENIEYIIQTRKKAKTIPYRIKKLTAGKRKPKRRKTNKTRRKSRKNKV